jgi:hypothetical protein
LDESKTGREMSLRAQMEAHRTNTVCASCHSRMDPLGFGLENLPMAWAVRWHARPGLLGSEALVVGTGSPLMLRIEWRRQWNRG